MDAGDLLLWPTSGASAGGLPLKQRNHAGDRCVLISEIVPADTSPGMKEAIWDDQQFRSQWLWQPTRAIASNAVVARRTGPLGGLPGSWILGDGQLDSSQSDSKPDQ